MAQKVEAVATEMAVVYFVYATIFGSCAISFATDEDFREGVKDFAGQVSDTVKNIVTAKALEIGNNISAGLQLAGYKISFSADEWKFITEDVQQYYIGSYNRLNVTPGTDGTLGFTDESIFSIQLQETYDGKSPNIQQCVLGEAILTLYDPGRYCDYFPKLPCSHPDFEKNNSSYVRYFTFSVPRLSLLYYNVEFPCNQRNGCCGTLTSVSMNNLDNFVCVMIDESSNGFGKVSLNLLDVTPNLENNYKKYYVINNEVCSFTKCDDGYYRFADGSGSFIDVVDSETGDTYDKFATPSDFYNLALGASDLTYPGDKGKDYVAPSVPSAPAVPDVYTGTDDVTLTIPKSVTSVDDYTAIAEANPSDIISYEKAIEYPDGVPKIDSSGLFDKFPFCIPKDIYNLFVGFSAESSPPKFDIPFKYMKQDDGSYLIDYTITIDFEQLSDIAYLCRWFISIEFVFGLIMITRKVIGAQ